MKLLIAISMVVATGLMSGEAFATGREAKVAVNGMVCSFCAQGITKKFRGRAEVEHIDVSLENKSVAIRFKDGKSLDDAAITELLTDAGYSVEKIERK